MPNLSMKRKLRNVRSLKPKTPKRRELSSLVRRFHAPLKILERMIRLYASLTIKRN
ncbi:hypothetical protein NC653_007767 [Populus alba x Populus x berolinensis]|uniref:Uncharacterized protein n=1 Tax=Populus alba x Populus x berolinensis TaxID=444605 RepID=A0AAD6R545_9ROSI|nr:hypothetical protein NC653_007767 [Populus alba x Populus x berolinensis]